ncbi:hypothetical protein BGZ54_000107, partial [Gamsiella multidivaricata]
GVACAQFLPADPFPLPYSTSPYYIKKQQAAVADVQEGDNGEDKEHGGRHRKHHHHGHYRHGRHHQRGHHHHHHHHHKHHRHGDDNEGISQDPPRRPVDSGYFYYHHTEADTMGAFTPDQVKNSAAVMAIWTYITAESPVEL